MFNSMGLLAAARIPQPRGEAREATLGLTNLVPHRCSDCELTATPQQALVGDE